MKTDHDAGAAAQLADAAQFVGSTLMSYLTQNAHSLVVGLVGLCGDLLLGLESATGVSARTILQDDARRRAGGGD